jgi:hypothetical protein
MQYTVVMHSAAGYKGDPTFARGLESRSVTAAQAAAVTRRGGVVFDSYGDAEDYAFGAQYPAAYIGLVPNAPGAFSAYKIDGLAVYVPKGDEKSESAQAEARAAATAAQIAGREAAV